MNKLSRLIGLATLVAGLLSACASTSDPAEMYKGESPQYIYMKGKAALQDKSFSESIKRFEALDVQYPYDTHTESAQLFLIYAYYMKEDYALSVAAADRFIRTHPMNPHVDYAYFMRGISDYYQNLGFLERIFAVDLATRDLVQIQKSFNDFNELTIRFPNSVYTPAAHQYMIYLRNILADHELHVAEYYYSRKAYVAAANRASMLVAHYQGAPTVEDGLVMMAKSYHQLGMAKSLKETLILLHYNYPNVVINYDAYDRINPGSEV